MLEQVTFSHEGIAIHVCRLSADQSYIKKANRFNRNFRFNIATYFSIIG